MWHIMANLDVNFDRIGFTVCDKIGLWYEIGLDSQYEIGLDCGMRSDIWRCGYAQCRTTSHLALLSPFLPSLAPYPIFPSPSLPSIYFT